MFAAGTVAAEIVNSNPYREGKRASPMDYVPDYERKKEVEPENDEDKIKAMAAFFGVGPGQAN